MFPAKMPQRRQQNNNPEECQIDVKKTKSGTRVRFKGRCSKEQIEYAKQEAKVQPDSED